MAIFDGGKMFKAIRKLSNFLGLGIPDKIDELFMPKTPSKKGLRVPRQGSSQPIPVVYGTQLVGGITVHKYVTDGSSKNRFLNVIVVFCEGEIDAFEEFFFNGVSWNDKRFKGKNGQPWFISSQLEGAPAQSSTLPIDNIPNWTSNHNLNGLAWAYFRFEQDKDQTIWAGEPKITARIRGKKVFDPRINQTVFSDNPALCLRDYLTNGIYGKKIPTSRIDDAKFIAAANNCDTVIDQVESTVVRSYYDEETKSYVTLPPQTAFTDITKHTCNLTIDTNATIFENVKILLNTFRGLLPPDYILGPIVEEAGSPSFTFDDSIITSDFVIKSPNINQRYNRVTVRFPNETSPTFDDDEAFWPATDSAIYQTLLDEDNGKILEKTFDFNGINNMAEAQQMAEFLCKKSRFQLSVTIDALPISGQVNIGDIVGVSNVDNGFVNKPFRVKDKTLLSNGDYRFDLLEHENNIYPWEDKAYTEIDGGTWLGDPGDVEAPTGLSFTGDTSMSSSGTLTWSADDNLFVRLFIVEITKTHNENGILLPTPLEILKSETKAPFFTVPILERGTYEFKVYKQSTVGTVSLPASLSIVLQNPLAPAGIVGEVDNFEIEVRATPNSGQGVGTGYQFAINNTSNPTGITGSTTFVNLSPNTIYTVFARSVNAFGVSSWISQQFTTLNDGTRIVEVIGDDISQVILPDVIAAVNDDLQQIVQDSLVDYPTRTEVTNEISGAISLVNSAFNEDPKADLLDTINNILDNYETEGNVKTEALERKTQVNTLTAATNDNLASITEIQTVVADLDSATAAQFNVLSAKVEDNESSIIQVNLAVSDLDSATAQQFTQLTASVNGNTASISSVSTALATETSTRATQVSQLQATDNNIISQINQVQSDIDGNFSSISALQATITNPVTGLSTTYGIAQRAESKADGNTTSITALTNQVEDPDEGLSATFSLASQAKITADGNVSSIAGLDTRVTTTEGNANAALTLSSQLDSSLNEYRASAQLKVDASGNVGFIQLDATPTDSSIVFQANQVAFKNSSGGSAIYFDNANGTYAFNGVLVAAGGTFSGNLQAAGGTFNGDLNCLVGTVTTLNTSQVNCSNEVGTKTLIATDRIECTGGPVVGFGSGLVSVLGNNTGNGYGVEGYTDSGVFAFYASKGGYGPFTGSHQGLVDKSFKAEPGDIVCDVELINIADISNAILKAEVSTRKEQRNVTGVFVGKHEINKDNLPVGLGGYKGDLSSYDIIGFNALGEGVINVCGEGGDIEAGDYICSSSIKGKAMKQFDQDFKRPYTIAKARHDVKFNDSDEVKKIAVKYLEG